jgi:hypothetical protein
MLNRRASLATLAAVAFSVGWGALAAQQPAGRAQAGAVDFVRDVQPILQKHCYACHAGERVKGGGLRLDLRTPAMAGGDSGAAIVPGQGGDSLIVRRLLGAGGLERMPMGKPPLPESDVAVIRAWIDQGAAWPEAASAADTAASSQAQPEHWAYRRPVRPSLPGVRDESWVRTPIDRFILARLEKEGLTPSPEAPPETLVRRVSLDLIGLPPSPAEVDEFVAAAGREGRDAAYEKLVDRLLASPHYGERWARPWLDLARYADSHGFEKDRPRVMWKYRDWVVDALNSDMPFDRFTIEQIAGDMLPDATRDQTIASGFHRNAMTNEEGGIDPEEALYEVLVDRVNTTATVWLGTTLGCAQCHNHKYDPFSQKDYYRMMAFFAATDYTRREFGDGTRFFEATIDVPTPEQEAKRKTIQAELDRLDERLSTQTPALDRAQVVWERAMRAEPSIRWTVLAPKRATSTGEVTLTPSHDGTVLASGPNPGEAVYTIEAVTTLQRITAIRLEALPDPSLPKGGPGRDVYGNFQLNGFEVEAQPLSPANAPVGTTSKATAARPPRRALSFTAIKADDSAGGASVDTFFPKSLPRDAYAPRGWRIDASREDTRRPRQIVFTLAAPLTAPAGTRLTVRMKHVGNAVGQAIGRFRLSATASAAPQRVVEIPAALRPVLSIPVASRTEQQRKDLAAFHRSVARSLKPARDRAAELRKELTALGIPTTLVMRERVSHERPSAFMRRRGSFMDKGERVYAGVPDLLHPLRDDQMPNRLGLAHWLVDERNPLTPRVAVNRAWEQLFGRGIVETTEDFGTQGSPPSHPELLDWLATELIDREWRMKALHRLIVTSAAYRQSSAAPAALVDRDPYNRLLARGPRFRMDAEMVRDSALTTSGLLSRSVGGPSVFPPQPDGIWDIPYSNDKWTTSEGPDRYRRGLYVFLRRSAAYPSFTTFDATSREFCTVRRVRTNTPLQALVTLNDEAFFEAAQALAARTLREAAPADEQRAAYAFRLVVSRAPTADERARILESYRTHLTRFRSDAAAAARVIGRYGLPGVGAAEQAAWTLVSNALLNLDEALTKE